MVTTCGAEHQHPLDICRANSPRHRARPCARPLRVLADLVEWPPAARAVVVRLGRLSDSLFREGFRCLATHGHVGRSVAVLSPRCEDLRSRGRAPRGETRAAHQPRGSPRMAVGVVGSAGRSGWRVVRKDHRREAGQAGAHCREPHCVWALVGLHRSPRG